MQHLPRKTCALCGGVLEADYSGEQERGEEYARRRDGLFEENYADDDGTQRAYPHPDGVSRAEGQRLCRAQAARS